MSELQLGLILIGGLLVAAVLLHNHLQERKVRRCAGTAAVSNEPGAPGRAAGTFEEGASRVAEPGPRAGSRTDVLASAALPDPRLDYVIELSCDVPVPAGSIASRWDGLVRRFRDRVLMAGASGDSGWHPVAQGSGANLDRLRVALQLVDRSGVTGEADLIEYRSTVENLAAGLGFRAKAPEMKTALDAARELDAFCADRDIQVALHVESRHETGFARAPVLAIGEGVGLSLDANGRFSCIDSAGRQLFTLADRGGARLDHAANAQASVLALSLTMDVPRTPDTRRSFEAMSRLASRLAADLGGTIVDDKGNALDERGLRAIEGELERIRGELDARGFPPGETLALRLFS